MRTFLLGSALALCLGAPAFAGSPTPPTPPRIAPVQVTETAITNVENAGGTTTTNVHTPNITLSSSLSVHTSLTVGNSISVATPGWSAP